MVRIRLLLLLLVAPVLATAQVYKSVGPDGRVSYSDTPPQRSSLPAARRAGSGADVAAPGLPYALQQAAAKAPVTLYTTRNCTPCEDGRKLLATRGIPYTEKTISSNEDLDALRGIAGNNDLPLLTVGRSREAGFAALAWQQALDAAGYPTQSRLPAGWRNPVPAPLASRPEAARTSEAPQAAQEPAPPSPPPQPPNGSAGIRF